MVAPDISFVVPVLDEAGSLEELYRRLVEVSTAAQLDYEFVFVDDGSTDASWQVLEQLHAGDPRVRGLRFSRNFGHQNALFAGLCASRGAAAISIDSDLQHPPEIAAELIAQWQAGFKVVNTVRVETQREGVFKRLSSKFFYKLFSFLAGSSLQPGMADFRLLDRVVIDELTSFREPQLFLRGLIQWMGFSSTTVEFRAGERTSGSSKYSVRRMAGLAAAGLTSFSVLPLRLSIFIGFITAGLAFAELVYVLVVALVYEQAVPGWASMTGVVSFLIGMLFVVLGVIGEYVGRIFEAVRNRPLYLVAEQLDAKPPTSGNDDVGA